MCWCCARERGALGVRGNHDDKVVRYLRALQRDEALPRTKGLHVAVAKALRSEDMAYLEALPLWLRFAALDTLVVHAGLVPGVPLERQDPEHLMTMRTLLPDGRASSGLDEGVLWGTRWQGPEHVVFGHDAFTGLQQHAFATGLDTGCVYGGSLSALLLPERRIVSVPAKRAYQEL
jgi:hypothetical protein